VVFDHGPDPVSLLQLGVKWQYLPRHVAESNCLMVLLFLLGSGRVVVGQLHIILSFTYLITKSIRRLADHMPVTSVDHVLVLAITCNF